MKLIGVDFTSAPSRAKPLTVCFGDLVGDVLWVSGFRTLDSFEQFERLLELPGPWLAAMDFPFGQPRRLVSELAWPLDWPAYMAMVDGLSRQGFEALLEEYKRERRPGDKEHRRECDVRAGALSPQKLYGVPLAKMFFEGARRLWRSGCAVPPLRSNTDSRVVVEGYPALVARRVIARRSYKNDAKAKQTRDQQVARAEILKAVLEGELAEEFGFSVRFRESLRSSGVDEDLVSDASGDRLDAMLCALQAAWAWTSREQGFGVGDEAVEGGIADPSLFDAAVAPIASADSTPDNLFAQLPEALPVELVEVLAQRDALRIERIVSRGQVTAEGEWLEEPLSEFVVLLSGAARLQFEGENDERVLTPGDWLLIEPHQRHRVSYTDPECDSVWLAVYFG